MKNRGKYYLLPLGVFFAACNSGTPAFQNSDLTAPTVTMVYPANGATGVLPTLAISASFSEDMNPDSINVQSFQVREGEKAVNGSLYYAGRTAFFTPQAPLATPREISVRLTAEISDTSGNALAEYVWSFTTGQGQWRDTQRLNPDGNATNPVLAVTPSGGAQVAWDERPGNGSAERLMARRFIPGLGWHERLPVIAGDNPAAAAKQLAADPLGNFLLSYQQDGVVKASYFQGDGSAWQTPVTVSPPNLDPAEFPAIINQVACDSQGNALVSWLTGSIHDSVSTRLYVNRFDRIKGWEAAQQLGGGNLNKIHSWVLGFDGNDDARLIFDQSDPAGIWDRHYRAAINSWETAPASPFQTEGQSLLAAFNRSGQAVLVYSVYDPAAKVINEYARYRKASGEEFGAPQLLPVTPTIGQSYTRGGLVIDDNGDVFLAYNISADASAQRFRVETAHYSAAADKWETLLVAERDQATEPWVALAPGPGGRAVAAWINGNDQTSSRLQVSRYLPGSGWGQAEELATSDLQRLAAARLGSDSYGRTLVVWQQTDYANGVIFARWLE